MGKLELVKQENFGEIQCNFYKKDENVYMTINQLAESLGYSNRKGIEKLIERNEYLKNSEFSVTDKLSGTDGKRYNTRVFTEDGIYEVTMLSKTEKAKEFRTWVRTVLKTIRKHEVYMTPKMIEEVLYNPDTIIKIATALKEEQTKVKELTTINSNLTVTNNIMKPKAEQFDRYIGSDGLIGLNQAAKALQTGRNKLTKFLKASGVFNKNNTPSAYYADRSYFVIKTPTYTTKYNTYVQTPVTFVTSKGMSFLYRYLKKHYDEYLEYDKNFSLDNVA